MMDAAVQFREVISTAGLNPPTEIEPGRFHRFPGAGKRNGNTAGWCKLFPDGRGGIFGDFATGGVESWQAAHSREWTPAEREAFRHNVNAERAAALAKRKAEHDAAARSATRYWNESVAALDDHGYLSRKGVRPHGVRVYRGHLSIHGMPCDGALLVPIRNAAGELRSLQFIAAENRTDGDDKRYIYSGEYAGGYHSIGKPNGVICVVEGYATGASVHETTGCAAAVAFTKDNLRAAAVALRAKYPELQIIVCADDDYRTAGNPGLTKATEAARTIGALLAVPDFGTARPEGCTDFNDMHAHRGPEAVKRAVENAKAPDIAELQEASADAAAVVVDGRYWCEPEPLPHGLPSVLSFDMAMLPDKLRPWVADICERVQCAPDFVGVAVMAALGSVIGRKVGIRPQNKTDWTVVANQWGALIGRPGVMKTPAMEQALAPLKRLAARAAEGHEAEIEQHKVAVRLAKLQAEAGEKRARKELNSNANADVAADLATEEPDAPILRRFIANDATSAALGELLLQNPNGTLVYRDELVSLLKNLDREDNAEARGFYLTGWNGDGAYTFDRIGRGMNLHIRAVCLSLLGSTQPGRIAEYVHSAVKGGAGDDGLIQRFGLTVWPDTAGEWRNVDRWPDSAARYEANGVFERLDVLDPTTVDARSDEFDALPYLRFDEEASATFVEWRATLETRLHGGELHPAMESHLAKYRKLVPGLALIIHLADGGSGAVSGLALLKALAWAEYLETHAKRLYGSATSPEVPAAKAIIQRLRRGDLPRSFASRDIYRKGWAHLAGRPQVEDALQLLIEYGWVEVTRNATPGRTAAIYTANPRGFQS